MVLEKIKQIEKYNKKIIELEEKKQQIKVDLFNYVNNVVHKTNFFITTENKIKTYYYFSSFFTKEPFSFYGIKINDDNTFEIGNITIDFAKISYKLESIEPIIFFNKAIFSNLSFDHNDLTKECYLYKFDKNVNNNENEKRCVGYCRKSCKSDKCYENQEDNIKNKAFQNGCEIEKFFNETINGTIPFEDRIGIKEMLEYCYFNNIDKIYVSEFARLGRSEKIIIEGIRFLRKNGINTIYIVSDNIIIDDEYLKNNYKELKKMAVQAEAERKIIAKRLATGRDIYIKKCKNEGIKMGRPSTYKKPDELYLNQYIEDIKLIKEKKSLRQINAITGTSIMTIRKVIKILKRNNLLENEDILNNNSYTNVEKSFDIKTKNALF